VVKEELCCSATSAQEKLESVLVTALTSIAYLGNISRIHRMVMLRKKLLVSLVNIMFNFCVEMLNWV
jgi:hypothetical protein